MNALSTISTFLRCIRLSVHAYWNLLVTIFTLEALASFAAVALSLTYAISSLSSGVDDMIICGMISGTLGVMAAVYSHISMLDRKMPFWFSLALQDFVALCVIATGAVFSRDVHGLQCTINDEADAWTLMANALINPEFHDIKVASETGLFTDTCGSSASQICPELYSVLAARCSGLEYLRISFIIQAAVCTIAVIAVAIEYHIYWGIVHQSNLRMERAILAREQALEDQRAALV